MISVNFEYDEDFHRWGVLVVGTTSQLEARQAFTAVVITCQDLDPLLLQHSQSETTERGVKITPAV